MSKSFLTRWTKNIEYWKRKRVNRPRRWVVLEECLVNFIWYKTKIRNLARKNYMMNVDSENLTSEKIKQNIMNLGVSRFNFFTPHMEGLQRNGEELSVLEIGPGGLLVHGIFLNSVGLRYTAIDAVHGNVFGVMAYKHYDYLREHWSDISSFLLTSRPIIRTMPSPESLNYYIMPLERAVSNFLGRFDYIISYGVFEHIANPEIAIERCADLIKKDGVMIHRIGFEPHDFWSGYNNPLEFLTVSKKAYNLMYFGRGTPNRIRFSRFMGMFQKAGFTVKVEGLEYFSKDVLDIRPRVDSSIEVANDEDLLLKGATFICRIKDRYKNKDVPPIL